MPRILLALFAVSLFVEQPPGTGVEFNLKVEAAWMGAGENPRSLPSFMQRALPDGSASWRITSDGRSLRSALTGRYLDLPSGIIVLQQDDQGDRYVINPADRTYYARKPEGIPPDEALEDVTIAPSNDVQAIAGFNTKKLVISFRRPLPAEIKNAGRPANMQTEIVNWCASDLGLPLALAATIDRRVQSFTPRQLAQQVAKVCPTALRSAYRLVSSTPDFAIVSTVTSVKRVPSSPELFQVPKEYAKILVQ